ncbi:MAG TPA: hypothetical protein PKM25_10580 [Candidatus Ozemobacteraceae bacterium]|nr:hypothetical protein [Candidatus Ozemobacteraceae bacterium]
MLPQFGVLLGGCFGIWSVILAAIKLRKPASPLHRWGARIAVLPGLLLFSGMMKRLIEYQVSLRMPSRGHVLLGILAFTLFVAKFMARRNWLVSPKRLIPLGYALAVIFPVAACGMIIPYALEYRGWQPLTPADVTERPDQTAFNHVCCSCHNRETATDGLGRRGIARWIEIVEPMAWAGALKREDARGALAALLATTSVSAPASARTSSASAPLMAADAIDRYCIGCHDRQRTTSETAKPRDRWERIIRRMQGYTQGRSDVASIPDPAILEVMDAVSSAGLIASPTNK